MDEILLTHPINPEEILWFLSRGFDEPMYRVKNNSVFRAFKIGDEEIIPGIRLSHILEV